jgi:Cyclic nucleotide-binding domain./Ion transport protein.
MFFLETGTVEIMSEDNKMVFATLTADNGVEQSQRSSVFFGETSLFFKKKRSGTVRAVTFCEVYRLLKKDLDAELGIGLGRDFDLGRMLSTFTSIAESNQKRNTAVARNLDMCRKKASKLSKLIDPNEGVRFSKQIPACFKPASPFRISCDTISVLILLYMAVEIPLRASFLYKSAEDVEENVPSWVLIDFFVEIYFAVELYLRIYHFPIMNNGVIVVDAEGIINEYMKNGLIVDALASVPVMFISFMVKVELIHLLYARVWHLVRLLRLPAYMTRIEGYLNLVTKMRISAATRLLYQAFLYYFIVVHIYGCIWFFIHRYQSSEQFTWATTDCPNGNEFATQGCLSVWVEETKQHDICHNDLIVRCYIRAVYFVFTTMSSVGYGKFWMKTEL